MKRPEGLVEARYKCESKSLEGPLWVRRKQENKLSKSWMSMDGPLSGRAWTLQENLLAPRVLRYGEKRLQWSCRSFQSDEEMPHYRKEPDGSRQLFRPIKYAGLFGFQSGNPALDCWYMIVNEFSRRKLTKQDDTLLAIAGLAKEIFSQTKFDYKADLWLEDIYWGLLWLTGGISITTETYAGPSWSWASARCRNPTELFPFQHVAVVDNRGLLPFLT